MGQTLFAVGAALLVAQSVSAVLLYRAVENRREAAVLNAAALSLLIDPDTRGRQFRRSLERMGREMEIDRPAGRPMRTRSSESSPLLPAERDSVGRSERLGEILSGQGLQPVTLQTTVRVAGDDPVLQQLARDRPRFAAQPGWADRRILVAGIQLQQGGPWRVARVPIPPREPRAVGGIVLQTLVLFVFLMAVLFFLLRRITRPLAALTQRTERFAATQDASGQLAPRGPDDISRLQAAHNAMENRIAAMLDEKDVMLGAIGHDLKTPLAALRVRIESVGDEAQRNKMAAGIEDITRSLDDILSLARIGRTDQPPEPAQLGALVESVVEEFEDMGEPVALEAIERIVAPIHLTWLRRALRNLISNALRYGKRARVSLLRANATIVLRVDDDGAGIRPDQIATMLEPFQRGETSRNRATGGAGLGLTLARAIAEQHGGTLVLSNRAEGGLRAEIRLPAP
ncbi:sensor histidine kinase [Parerythrobacter aestuarii]|uniref:sensor histidine kinase n=1 Tax=Parerythrobacter aestuarii TaxID=3020909 RepID=UPI002DD6A52E|nr:ATP-binding protein [Parerythrobacter aestuarii]